MLATWETSAKRQDASSDIFTCDSVCMQCPEGRNILIKRQAHAATDRFLGKAGAVVGCPKIGFEFWENHELDVNQPFRSSKLVSGWMWMSSGLDKLKWETRKLGNPDDMEATEACNKLTSRYAWQALPSASSSWRLLVKQYGRRCLSHTQLCGMEVEADLQVAHFDPFADKSMCSSSLDQTLEQSDATENHDLNLPIMLKSEGKEVLIAEKTLDFSKNACVAVCIKGRQDDFEFMESCVEGCQIPPDDKDVDKYCRGVYEGHDGLYLGACMTGAQVIKKHRLQEKVLKSLERGASYPDVEDVPLLENIAMKAASKGLKPTDGYK